MSEATENLNGPNFTQGIPVSAITDGAMLLGHAHGERALIARRGEELLPSVLPALTTVLHSNRDYPLRIHSTRSRATRRSTSPCTRARHCAGSIQQCADHRRPSREVAGRERRWLEGSARKKRSNPQTQLG
jgi:hypothetical protein